MFERMGEGKSREGKKEKNVLGLPDPRSVRMEEDEESTLGKREKGEGKVA